jgi:hypothetical protein
LVLRRDKRPQKGLQVTVAALKRLARTYSGELEGDA